MVNTAGARKLGELAPNALNRLKEYDYDPKALRTNRTLPEDAWKEIDETIYGVARKRLQAINALRDAGVTNNLGGLHVLFDQWETMSDMGEVEQAMDFRNEAPNDAPDFNPNMIPIPLTMGDFEIGFRKMSAMENAGNITINTAMVSQVARHISEKLEDTLFHGTDITLNGSPAPGLLTHSDAVDATGDADWTGSWGTNPGEIYEDVKHLISQAKGQSYYGPYLLFAAQDAYDAMNIPDPEGSGDKELLDRIMNKPKIQDIIEVDRLDADTVVLLDPTPEVIQLSTAADIQAIEWETNGGYVSNYKIFSAMAPRVMSDDEGKTGIVYATDA